MIRPAEAWHPAWALGAMRVIKRRSRPNSPLRRDSTLSHMGEPVRVLAPTTCLTLANGACSLRPISARVLSVGGPTALPLGTAWATAAGPSGS